MRYKELWPGVARRRRRRAHCRAGPARGARLCRTGAAAVAEGAVGSSVNPSPSGNGGSWSRLQHDAALDLWQHLVTHDDREHSERRDRDRQPERFQVRRRGHGLAATSVRGRRA